MNGIMKQTSMNGYASYETAVYEQSPNELPAPQELMGKCTRFQMMTMGIALLMCAGIVLYALLTV